jgi:hypothetical protein
MTADASVGDSGVTDGGTAECVPGTVSYASSCPCTCQDGGCSGTCVIRELRPGVVVSPFGSNLPVALTASGNRVFAVTTNDGGGLLELNQDLQALSGSLYISGTLRTLDARRGVGLAVTSDGLFSTNGVNLPYSNVRSCQGGGVYDRGAGLMSVAACQWDDGGFAAIDVLPSGLSGANSVALPLPPNTTDQALVWIRPDNAGMVGRYLIRPDAGSSWAYRSFTGSIIEGTDSFSANQAVLATTESQTAMLAVRNATGIVRYRPLATTLVGSTQTSLTSPRVDLRGVFSFSGDGGTSFPVDVYVLERDGTAAPTFRGFTLSSQSVNGWFVVLDRPQGVVVYSLGDVDSAQAVIVDSRGLLVLSRCSVRTGSSVCMADAGSYFEWLPLD